MKHMLASGLDDEDYVTVNLRVTNELATLIHAHAGRLGLTPEEFIVYTIIRYVEYSNQRLVAEAAQHLEAAARLEEAAVKKRDAARAAAKPRRAKK